MYNWPFKQLAVREVEATLHAELPPIGRYEFAPPADLVLFLTSNLTRSKIQFPGDRNYDAARRTFNPRFDDSRPWALVSCATELDVELCLAAVRTLAVPFCVRSAGHSLCGYSSIDRGLVIDVSALNQVRIDLERREATVQAGCALKTFQDKLALSGLTLPLGGGEVGIAGFVQGGGFGTTSRTFGMHSDHVLALRVMLADGTVVEASETRNHDLWWACRGGTGGNFGIVLEVRYRLHNQAEHHSWSISWPIKELASRDIAVTALLAWQDRVVGASGPEMNSGADLRYWPMADFEKPTTLRLYVYGTYYGTKAQTVQAIQPLSEIPGAETFDAHYYPMLPVLRQARFVSALTGDDWRTIVDDFADHANRHSTLTIDAWGGAINEFPCESSAFIHRKTAFNMYVTGFWSGAADEQRMRAYLSRWRESVARRWNDGVYQNFADSDCPDYTRNYWCDAYPGLVGVKRKYDPHSWFAFPQMIAPPGTPSLQVTWPSSVVEWLARPIET